MAICLAYFMVIVHVAAVIDRRGKILDTGRFETTVRGYRQLLAWLRSFGELDKVGIEGTGAYGAGLARHLGTENVCVVEVNRPNRQLRRRRGKSDTVDAEAAARAALNGEATVTPKTQAGIVESIRVLRVAFTSARDARTRVALQVRDIVLTAPDQLRAVLGPLPTAARVARCARFKTTGDLADPVESTKRALRTLARRHEALSAEMSELDAALDELTLPGESGPARCQRRRRRRGGHPAWGGRRQSRPTQGRGSLRRHVRGLADRSFFGQDRAPSVQPLGRSPGQSRPVADRDGAAHLRSGKQGLRGPANG